jgi:hypothetical protein
VLWLWWDFKISEDFAYTWPLLSLGQNYAYIPVLTCGFQTKPILVQFQPLITLCARIIVGDFFFFFFLTIWLSIEYSWEYRNNYRAIACSSCKAFSCVFPAVLLGHLPSPWWQPCPINRPTGSWPTYALGAVVILVDFSQFPTLSCHDVYKSTGVLVLVRLRQSFCG